MTAYKGLALNPAVPAFFRLQKNLGRLGSRLARDSAAAARNGSTRKLCESIDQSILHIMHSYFSRRNGTERSATVPFRSGF